MDTLPFPAIVGQEELKFALLLNAINPSLGGVLIRGDKGTGKSSTVRGLKRILPERPTVADCVFNCHPDEPRLQCQDCRDRTDVDVEYIETPVVELPLGATEDRVIGTLDIERALNEGAHALEPGLLARANRGILYIDEVNLLDDHLIDILLDAAASGVNRVEREGVSVEHPAEFILVGTMNPAEGELRPQFLDRFGLQVEAGTPDDPEKRATIIEVAETFDRDPERVFEKYGIEEERLRDQIERAREIYDDVTLSADLRQTIAEICIDAGIEGNRGDIITARCARTIAAMEDRTSVEPNDVSTAIRFALPHRIPNDPFEERADLDTLLDEHFEESSDDGSNTPPQDADEGSDDTQSEQGKNRQRGGSESRQDDPEGAFGGTLQSIRDLFPGSTAGEEEADGNEGDGNVGDGAKPRSEEGPDEANQALLDPIGAGEAAGSSPQADGSEWDPERTGLDLQEAYLLESTGNDRNEHAQDRSGKYVRACNADSPTAAAADIAMDASVRAAARRGSAEIGRQDLQLKIRDEERPALVVFAIDSSASMRAHGHLATVKELISDLVQNARQRCKYAVVAFHDETAELIVPPTDSRRVLFRGLDGLPRGNKTPLAHGLTTSLRCIEHERQSDPHVPAILLVITDGRPTVAMEEDPVDEVNRLSRELRRADVHPVVLDMDTGSSGTEVCQTMAEEADGDYVSLDGLPDDAKRQVVTRTVRSIQSRL